MVTVLTNDKWSGEEYRKVNDGLTLSFKPYAAFSMFAVFAWRNGVAQAIYDGPDEHTARFLFEK